jgi:ribonuclease Y
VQEWALPIIKLNILMDTTTILIAGAVGLLIGFIIAKFLEKGKASKTLANAKKEAAMLLKNAENEGENIKKDKIFQAKEKFLELKAEHEKVIINKDKKISESEKRTRDKESQVSSEMARNKKLNDQMEDKIKDLDHKVELYDKKHSELEKLQKTNVRI